MRVWEEIGERRESSRRWEEGKGRNVGGGGGGGGGGDYVGIFSKRFVILPSGDICILILLIT